MSDGTDQKTTPSYPLGNENSLPKESKRRKGRDMIEGYKSSFIQLWMTDLGSQIRLSCCLKQ
jgi:hypothetical protein